MPGAIQNYWEYTEQLTENHPNSWIPRGHIGNLLRRYK